MRATIEQRVYPGDYSRSLPSLALMKKSPGLRKEVSPPEAKIRLRPRVDPNLNQAIISLYHAGLPRFLRGACHPPRALGTPNEEATVRQRTPAENLPSARAFARVMPARYVLAGTYGLRSVSQRLRCALFLSGCDARWAPGEGARGGTKEGPGYYTSVAHG